MHVFASFAFAVSPDPRFAARMCSCHGYTVQSGWGAGLDTCRRAAPNLPSTGWEMRDRLRPRARGRRAAVCSGNGAPVPILAGAACRRLLQPYKPCSMRLGQPCWRGRLSPCPGCCPAPHIWICPFRSPRAQALHPWRCRAGWCCFAPCPAACRGSRRWFGNWQGAR